MGRGVRRGGCAPFKGGLIRWRMGGDRCPAAGLSATWKRSSSRTSSLESDPAPGLLELTDGHSVVTPRPTPTSTPTPTFGQLQPLHESHEEPRGKPTQYDEQTPRHSACFRTTHAGRPATSHRRRRGPGRGRPRRGGRDVGRSEAPGSGHRSEALAGASHHGNPLLPPADAPPSGVGVKTGVPGLLAADHAGRSAAGATNAAATVHGSFSVFNGAETDDAPSSGASGLPSGGTSVAPSLPSTASSSAPNPVTQLTSNVGATVSTTTQQISAIVPAATPITGVVNNVASTVSGLTGTVASPNT